MYCGHDGYFVADLIIVGGACVVIAASPNAADPGKLFRNDELGPPTHHLADFPQAGVWLPRKGFFVVPSAQVKVLQRGGVA